MALLSQAASTPCAASQSRPELGSSRGQCTGGFIPADFTSDLSSDGAQAWLQCLLLQGRADAEKEQAKSRSCAD